MADKSPSGAKPNESPIKMFLHDNARPSVWPTALVLLVLSPLIYSATFLDGATFDFLIDEERPIELLGALGLLAACFACLVLWRNSRGDPAWPGLRRLSLLGYGALFFFGFGEEISWGQRIYGLETPASIAAVNEQQELNIHNLSLFNFINTTTLFAVLWLVTGVVVPVLALWPTPRRHLERFLPILPVALSGLFILNQFLFWGFEAFFARYPQRWESSFPMAYSIGECKETVASLLLGTGFLLILLRYRRSRADR